MDKIIFIFKLLPSIIQAVKALEEAIGEAGKGPEKLQAVREMLEQIDSSVAAVWPQVQGVIGVLVKLFNKTGWKQS
jgi:hypothetical protein